MRTVKTIFTFRCNSCGKEKRCASHRVPKGWKKHRNADAHICPTCQRMAGQMPHNLTPEQLRKRIMTFATGLGGRRV